jgi:hypothetical protein
MNEKVLSREATLEYILKKYENKERIILTRYNDGENLLMHGLEKGNVKRLIGDGSSKILKDLLLNSIKDKRQFICTNYLKESNSSPDNQWNKVQQYFVELGAQDLYGCSHWTVHDFCNENKLLPYFFSGKTLVSSGICEYFEPVIKKYNKNIYCYSTPNINAQNSYEKIKLDLIKLSKNFQNIVLCCGPLSKVLVVDLIEHCDAHLVDLGCITNAVCGKDDIWTMSWTKTVNLKECANNFLSKVKNELV